MFSSLYKYPWHLTLLIQLPLDPRRKCPEKSLQYVAHLLEGSTLPCCQRKNILIMEMWVIPLHCFGNVSNLVYSIEREKNIYEPHGWHKISEVCVSCSTGNRSGLQKSDEHEHQNQCQSFLNSILCTDPEIPLALPKYQPTGLFPVTVLQAFSA